MASTLNRIDPPCAGNTHAPQQSCSRPASGMPSPDPPPRAPASRLRIWRLGSTSRSVSKEAEDARASVLATALRVVTENRTIHSV